MSNSYWDRQVRSRVLSRRALLAASGAGMGVVALSLVGCGGSDDSGGDSSGLVVEAKDTIKQAKRGGTWTYVDIEAPIASPMLATSQNGLGGYSYSRLLRNKVTLVDDLDLSGVEPDVAESFEESPDGLKITFKINPNVLLDPRPPTNGRKLTAADVKYSWDVWSTVNASRGELSNAANANSPVLRLEQSDDHTVTFHLAFPLASMASRFAYRRGLYIMPTEAEGKFDAKTETRGSGPWMLVKNTPSSGMEFERSPQWHVYGGKQPFFDKLNIQYITDYSNRIAQLKAGTLLTSDVRQEDVLSIKRETPGLNMYAQLFPLSRPEHVVFSELDSQFKDVRVRQAVSMLLDRDAWIDTFFNVPKFTSEGLTVEKRWHTHFAAGEPPYWHDPQGKELGDAAKNFQYNVEEATKLLKAAGITKLDTPVSFETPLNDQRAQVFAEMLNASGIFNVTLRPLPRNDYVREIHTGKGQFQGLGFGLAAGTGGDVDQYLTTRFNLGATNFTFFTENRYPKIQDLVVHQRKEINREKRLDLLKDLEKQMATEMPSVPFPGIANGFDLAWPTLGNFNAYVSADAGQGQNAASGSAQQLASAEIWPQYWYDESKKS